MDADGIVVEFADRQIGNRKRFFVALRDPFDLVVPTILPNDDVVGQKLMRIDPASVQQLILILIFIDSEFPRFASECQFITFHNPEGMMDCRFDFRTLSFDRNDGAFVDAVDSISDCSQLPFAGFKIEGMDLFADADFSDWF
jgi:hypothetical protein